MRPWATAANNFGHQAQIYDCEQGCLTDWHDLNQRGGTNQWNQRLLFLLGYTRPSVAHSWVNTPGLHAADRAHPLGVWCGASPFPSSLPLPKGTRGRIAQAQLTADLSRYSFKQASPHTMHIQGQQVDYPTSVKAGFKPPCKQDFTLLKHSRAKHWIPSSSGGATLLQNQTFDLALEQEKTEFPPKDFKEWWYFCKNYY